MSSDSGPRKRFKDKKRKKGSVSDTNVPIIVQKNSHSMKAVMDETMHVQNETKFGGSILSKLIFLIVLLGIGSSLFFMLTPKKGEDESGENLWLQSLRNFLPYFSSETSEGNNREETSHSEPVFDLVERLWDLLPFYGETNPYSKENDDVELGKLEDLKDHINSAKSNQNLEDTDDNPEDDEEQKENDHDSDEDSNDNRDDSYDDENNLHTINRENDEEPLELRVKPSDRGDDSQENEDETANDTDDVNDLEELKIMPPRYNYFHNVDQFEHLGDDNQLKNTDDDDDSNDSDPSDDDESNDELLGSQNQEDFVESSDDRSANETTDESEQSTTNVVTKLGVGIALMFVAYSVIIRKWNDYENLVPPVLEEDDSDFDDELSDIENDSSTWQQYPQHQFNIDQASREDLSTYKNGTNDELSETPTDSENADVKDNVMRWSTSNSAKILAHEIEDSDSVTSDSAADNSESDSHDQYLSQDYGKTNITNRHDWQFKDELDEADHDFDNRHYTDSLNKYEKVLRTRPHSARARFGVAKSLDAKAELRKSNELLMNAIQAYINVLYAPEVPDALFKIAAERVINRLRFKGEYESCVAIHDLLIQRFPDSVVNHNDLVVTLLMLNRITEARQRLEQILNLWPDDGLALVHYGFVLKLDGNLTAAVTYLEKGINTKANGTQEGRFYFHLGDALQRLGRNDEAMKIYQNGAKKGLFLSEYQRSLYNVKRLKSRPWWTLQQTTYEKFFIKLKKHWRTIRNEGVSLLKLKNTTTFVEESEQLREMGDWKQFELFNRGIKRSQCLKAPVTCRLIGEFKPAAGCRRGQIKFSVMEPGTHVWPHCGPTNCRLRAHLGLVVPSNVTIRVASETRLWEEGEILVFDDSFEHEVWHNGTSFRLILIIDVWHPELSEHERKALAAI